MWMNNLLEVEKVAPTGFESAAHSSRNLHANHSTTAPQLDLSQMANEKQYIHPS